MTISVLLFAFVANKVAVFFLFCVPRQRIPKEVKCSGTHDVRNLQNIQAGP